METTDTLALATEALAAEGAAAYFDATPAQLAEFLDENPTLWTADGTFDTNNLAAFRQALAQHLDVYTRATKALRGINGARVPETIGETIVGNLLDAGFSVPDDYELTYDNPEQGYTGQVAVDTGWPDGTPWIVFTFCYDGHEGEYTGTWEWSA